MPHLSMRRFVYKIKFLYTHNNRLKGMYPVGCSLNRISSRRPASEHGRASGRLILPPHGCVRSSSHYRRLLWNCKLWSGRKPVPPFHWWARRSWTCRQKSEHQRCKKTKTQLAGKMRETCRKSEMWKSNETGQFCWCTICFILMLEWQS